MPVRGRPRKSPAGGHLVPLRTGTPVPCSRHRVSRKAAPRRWRSDWRLALSAESVGSRSGPCLAVGQDAGWLTASPVRQEGPLVDQLTPSLSALLDRFAPCFRREGLQQISAQLDVGAVALRADADPVDLDSTRPQRAAKPDDTR